jgi:intein-encoded DNA endonuclease-like protein
MASGNSSAVLSEEERHWLVLQRAGASYLDLVIWLRTQHRVRVNHTTVMRYLKTLPELQKEHPDEHTG